MTDAIRLAGVSKEFVSGWRKTRSIAVSDVSLAIAEGEAFGFIGPNGAGKSTTIKMITGLLLPTSGDISLFGESANRPISRKGLGYVPENPYLFDYLTPIEILTMSMRLNGLRLPNERAHCLHWLERFQLTHVADRAIRSFSKGMTQRVALAQALSLRPRLLILDEPLSGLDPIGRRDVVELLAEYKKSGGTLFFTSHVLHDVERLADRFGLIHQGKIRAVRSPSELAGADDLLQIRSTGSTPVGGMQEEYPGRWVGIAPRSQVWARLDELRAGGHQLVEIKPTLSLESAFMRAVGEEVPSSTDSSS
jgi:ABC-2 type transport system ATP-binding protein